MAQKAVRQENTEHLSLKIEGMHCASCVATIEKTLLSKDGVIKASVSLLDEKAVVEYKPDSVTRTDLEKAVDSTGYRVRRAMMTITLSSEPTDAQWTQITKSLNAIPGVISTKCYPETKRLLIEYDEDLVTFKIVRKTLKNMNFEIEASEGIEGDRESLAREREIRFYSTLLVFSIILT
ncbi:MAG: hypothetical protein BV458_07280, partial [Thermoplasmata archaeon M9B2D]